MNIDRIDAKRKTVIVILAYSSSELRLAFSGKNRVQFGIPYPYTLHFVIIQCRIAVYRQIIGGGRNIIVLF